MKKGLWLASGILVSALAAWGASLLYPMANFRVAMAAIVFGGALLTGFILFFFLRNRPFRIRIRFIVGIGILAIGLAFYYNMLFGRYVCHYTEDQLDDNRQLTEKVIPFISGDELEDASNPKMVALNAGPDRCSLCKIKALDDPTKIWKEGSVWKIKSRFKFSLAALGIFGAAFLLSWLLEFWVRSRKPVWAEPTRDVFISYSSRDKATAEVIYNLLHQANLSVIWDDPDLRGGNDIKEFIINSIRDTRVTLNIVSNSSLLSGWVGSELVNTFFLQSFDKSHKFIACYLDNDFITRTDFVSSSLITLNSEMEANEEEARRLIGLKSDTQHVNDKRTRLQDLHDNLNKIVAALNRTKCIDISGGLTPPVKKEVLDSVKECLEQE